MFTGFLLPRGPRDVPEGSPWYHRDAKPAEREVPRVTVRLAEAADLPALYRIAALDSARLPEGRLVVAEVAHSIQAALSLDDGRSIANPFVPTADLLRLLETRAAQLREDDERGRVVPVRRRVRARLV
jgi:hypothetical protein